MDVIVKRNDAVTAREVDAIGPDAVVISPGPRRPEHAGVSVELIRRLTGRVPVLGVCLGHQCIGYAYGARIVKAEHVCHGKTSLVRHDRSGAYRDLENPFVAARYHSLVIDPETVPACLDVVARTEDGVIMGVRHRQLPVEGVQFHPESILTPDGPRLMGNFLGVAAAEPRREAV